MIVRFGRVKEGLYYFCGQILARGGQTAGDPAHYDIGDDQVIFFGDQYLVDVEFSGAAWTPSSREKITDVVVAYADTHRVTP